MVGWLKCPLLTRAGISPSAVPDGVGLLGHRGANRSSAPDGQRPAPRRWRGGVNWRAWIKSPAAVSADRLADDIAAARRATGPYQAGNLFVLTQRRRHRRQLEYLRIASTTPEWSQPVYGDDIGWVHKLEVVPIGGGVVRAGCYTGCRAAVEARWGYLMLKSP